MTTITETPTSWVLAVEKITEDVELWGGWIQSASTVRENSAYFIQPISNAELVRMMLSGTCSGEQLQQCIILLRMRFIAEHCELIALEATKIAEES